LKYKKEEIWGESEKFYRRVFSSSEAGIKIHNGQPGSGKTYSLSKAIASSGEIEVAIFSANHKHLEKIYSQLILMGVPEDEIIHGKGFSKSCVRFPTNINNMNHDERFVYNLYRKLGSGDILCSNCQDRSYCEHYEYKHSANNYRITLQPFEYLSSNLNSDKEIFVVDEALLKVEKLDWSYSLRKLHSFIQIIKDNLTGQEEFNLDRYEESLLNIHKDFLRNCSIIFKEEPSNIFNLVQDYSSMSDYAKERFYEIKSIGSTIYITHPSGLKLLDDLKNKNDLLKIYHLNSDIEDIAFQLIRRIFVTGNRIAINNLFRNYISHHNLFKFIRTLLNTLPKDSDTKRWFLVHENLEITNLNEISDEREIREENENYERGFINDLPYIIDKTTNRVVISKIGRNFENRNDEFSTTKKSWFSFGTPYMHYIMNNSMTKPVILLDATFREEIFKKFTKSWWYRSIINASAHGRQDIVRKFKRTEESNLIQKNTNSFVYDIKNPISGYGHFPLQTLRTGRWIDDIRSFIHFCNLEYNLNSVGIICHQEFEQNFQRAYPQSTVLHHRYQRGEDIDSDFLFIIGTPFRPPSADLFDYILLFNEYPKSMEIIENGRFRGYKDELLNEIYGANVTDEIYQELHRTRMLLNNRKVYAFCDVPDRIKEEVSVEIISDFKSHRYLAMKRLLGIIEENEPIGRTPLRNRVRNLSTFIHNPFDIILSSLMAGGFVEEILESTRTKPKRLYKLTSDGKDFLRILKRTINY